MEHHAGGHLCLEGTIRPWGGEFVYPRAGAVVLAKETRTAVRFTEAPLPVKIVEPIKTADAPVVVEDDPRADHGHPADR
jgi:hypothetical protein